MEPLRAYARKLFWHGLMSKLIGIAPTEGHSNHSIGVERERYEVRERGMRENFWKGDFW